MYNSKYNQHFEANAKIHALTNFNNNAQVIIDLYPTRHCSDTKCSDLKKLPGSDVNEPWRGAW